jgi:cytochrome c biogenesis protein CcmG, thiol:disulfide interchange protein DsbE
MVHWNLQRLWCWVPWVFGCFSARSTFFYHGDAEGTQRIRSVRPVPATAPVQARITFFSFCLLWPKREVLGRNLNMRWFFNQKNGHMQEVWRLDPSSSVPPRILGGSVVKKAPGVYNACMSQSIRITQSIAVLAAFLAACTQPAKLPGDVGEAAPVYVATTLAGDSLSLASLKGEVVLLNVWATWCIPCRKEIPELQALHQELSGRGLRVVGVSVDEGNADEDVAGFAKDFSMTYTILRDPGEGVSNAFRVPGVPSSFLIDRKGIVRWRRIGVFKTDDVQFRAALEASL